MSRRNVLIRILQAVVLFAVALVIAAPSFAFDMPALIVKKKAPPAGGGANGKIGNSVSETGNNAAYAPGAAYFSIYTTTTAGSVRYGHINLGTLQGADDNICLSLQQDADGGTVYLYAVGVTTGGAEWLHIDMGSSYTIAATTNYRLVVQSQRKDMQVELGGFGSTPDVRQDAGVAYNPGVSVTNDSQKSSRRMGIVFNNHPTDQTQ